MILGRHPNRSLKGRCGGGPSQFHILALRSFQQFPHAPNVVRNACCHRRGHAERLMAAAEVVMGEMQGDSRAVVFQLFTEPVRQAGEPAHGQKYA